MVLAKGYFCFGAGGSNDSDGDDIDSNRGNVSAERNIRDGELRVVDK